MQVTPLLPLSLAALSVNFADPDENREQTLTGCPTLSPAKTLVWSGQYSCHENLSPLSPACPPPGGRGRGPGAPEGG